MPETIFLQNEYVVVSCGEEGCDQHFAMSRRFYDETRRTGCSWHCPRGHTRVWKGPTTEQRLRDAESRELHLKDQLRAAEDDAEASRVRLLKERERIANGVCPRCNRSFTALTRHIATQHPNYDPGDLTPPLYQCSCGTEFGTFRGLRIHQGRSRPDDWTDPTRSRWSRHLTVTR